MTSFFCTPAITLPPIRVCKSSRKILHLRQPEEIIKKFVAASLSASVIYDNVGAHFSTTWLRIRSLFGANVNAHRSISLQFGLMSNPWIDTPCQKLTTSGGSHVYAYFEHSEVSTNFENIVRKHPNNGRTEIMSPLQVNHFLSSDILFSHYHFS